MIILTLVSAPAEAQRSLNLSFEEPSIVSPAQAWGWSGETEGYEVVRDSSVPHSGRWSLRASGAASQSRQAWWMPLPREIVAGKRVQISGWIRTNGLKHGSAGLGINFGRGGAGEVAHERMPAGARGTTSWTRYIHEVPVDSSATWVELEVFSEGPGTAWFDDLSVEVEGVSYDVAPTGAPPTEEQVAWLRRHAVPIRGAGVGQGWDDLRPLGEIIGDAHVIALGEGTHGTREFFQMKHRILEYAVHELGVRVFAIEANQLEAERVNRYVLTGEGDARSAMSGLFQVTKTEEVLDLIEWIRAYNSSAREPVEFIGFDMQDPSLPVDSVLAFLSRADPAYLPRARSAYEGMREAWRTERYPSRPDSVHEEWRRRAEEVLGHLRRRQREYRERMDAAAVEWALQNATVAYQAAANATDRGGEFRDSTMAANLEWALARRGPHTRAIVWAHNAHVARTPGSLGHYLARLRGDDLRVIAQATYAGEYRAAIDPVTREYAAVPAYPAPPGSVEDALHRVGIPEFVLDLRIITGDARGTWLLEPREFRSIGWGADDYGFWPLPAGKQFDTLIFLNRTSASRPLSGG